MQNCGIYMIKNLKNGKVYIGKSKQIMTRWKRHYMMLQSNTHHSGKLQEDWILDGEDNFTFMILEMCPEKILDEREKTHIIIHDAKKSGYNSESHKQNSKLKYKRFDKSIDKLLGFGKSIVKQDEIVLVYLEDFLNYLRFNKDELFKTIATLNRDYYKKYNTYVQIDVLDSELALAFCNFNADAIHEEIVIYDFEQ